jgi:DNA-binding response OmpR family regulator
VWQYDGHDLGLVCTHVKRLRAKIETEPSRPEIVMTVRGFGYMVAAAA